MGSNTCSKCGKKEDLPYTCNFCHQTFCSKHRLPEAHDCKVLEVHKKGNKERWTNALNNIHPSESHKVKRRSDKRKIPQIRFDFNAIPMDLLYLVSSILLTLFIYNQISFFNKYNLLFIRIGSVLLIAGTCISIKYIYQTYKQIRSKYNYLSRDYKLLLFVCAIILLLFVYMAPERVTGLIQETTDKIDISHFNPFAIPNASMNIEKLTAFLPLPWGFLAFWGVLIIITLSLVSKFVFGGELPNWLWSVLLIIGIILVFQYKIPYDVVEIKSGLTCDNDDQFTIKNNYLGLGELQVALNCADYKSSQCKIICESEKPFCQCKANLIDLVFHQKGDWMLGGF